MRRLVLFAAYEDIALGFMEEYVGKPYADLEDKIMQRLLDMQSSYFNLKPLTEHVVHYMQTSIRASTPIASVTAATATSQWDTSASTANSRTALGS